LTGQIPTLIGCVLKIRSSVESKRKRLVLIE